MKKIDIKNKLSNFKSKNSVTKIEGLKILEELELELYIKSITAKERMRLADKATEYYNIDLNEMQGKSKDELKDIKVSAESNYMYMMCLASVCLCDDEGALVFSDENEAAEILDNFPQDDFAKVLKLIQENNAIEGEEDIKKQEGTLEQGEN